MTLEYNTLELAHSKLKTPEPRTMFTHVLLEVLESANASPIEA